MMRLRLGKLPGSGGVPRGYSLTMSQCAAMRWAKSRFLRGYTRSSPVPTTAMVAAMVFRTFERVSYVLLLEIRNGVRVGDRLVNPK